MPVLFEMPFAQRGENVASVIRSIAPHVLCLSERHNEWAGILDADAMDGAVNLSKLLEGSCCGVADDYMPCGDAVVANRVPIFYDPAVLRCVDSGILKLTDEYPFERSENKRTLSWAILEDITDTDAKGQRMAVFNTHWSIKEYKERSLAHIRAAQCREMQALINEERFAEMPRLVCGDFNTAYSEELMTELIQGCGLQHADVTVNGRLTWDCVDHIAATGVELKSYVVQKEHPVASDHHPIYVDFTITK